MPARVLLFTLVLTTPLMAKAGDLVELLQTRKCPDCQLTDVDLVHSDLRDADLQDLSFSGPTSDMRGWMALT